MGEAVRIGVLDTFVAFMAGLIIFPACFAFGVSPDQRRVGLIFVTLPNIFNEMPLGRLWGALFFVFLSFAALSTVIAVFENIISFAMDRWGWSRRKAVAGQSDRPSCCCPCPAFWALTCGAASSPSGPGSNIMDLEDFLISDNLLPLGSLVYLLFCVSAARAGAGRTSWRRPTPAAACASRKRCASMSPGSCPLSCCSSLWWAIGTASAPPLWGCSANRE